MNRRVGTATSVNERSVSSTDSVSVNVSDSVNESVNVIVKENNIESRKLKFASTLQPFLLTYGKDFLNDFYKYWTEPNKSNTKFKQELEKTLTANGNQGFVFSSTPPTVVLMTGLQGSGKTTTTGKLANYLKVRNKKVLVAACDLQRLAAVEQLKQIAASIDVDIYFDDTEKNPVKIAKSAIEKGKKEHYDVVLIDTAGRLQRLVV